MIYNGIEFDSEEERLFYLYLDELKERGFVREFSFHSESFTLSEKVTYDWIKKMKTKNKKMESTLLQSHVYVPDFKILWNSKAYGIFYLDIDDGKNKLDSVPFINNIGNDGYDVGSFIEIKPSFDFQNMTRLAIINIKWVYCEYKILVQKITPVAKTKCLFKDTFVPKKALLTKTGKKKKYHFVVKSLEDYINNCRIEKDRG